MPSTEDTQGNGHWRLGGGVELFLTTNDSAPAESKVLFQAHGTTPTILQLFAATIMHCAAPATSLCYWGRRPLQSPESPGPQVTPH